MGEDERYILEGKSFIDTMTNQCLNYGIKDLIRVCITLNNQDTQIGMLQQQLADHDKEVRNQVCDDIREILNDEIEIMGYCQDDETDTETSLIKMSDIEHILDQIEKGDKENEKRRFKNWNGCGNERW